MERAAVPDLSLFELPSKHIEIYPLQRLNWLLARIFRSLSMIVICIETNTIKVLEAASEKSANLACG